MHRSANTRPRLGASAPLIQIGTETDYEQVSIRATQQATDPLALGCAINCGRNKQLGLGPIKAWSTKPQTTGNSHQSAEALRRGTATDLSPAMTLKLAEDARTSAGVAGAAGSVMP